MSKLSDCALSILESAFTLPISAFLRIINGAVIAPSLAIEQLEKRKDEFEKHTSSAHDDLLVIGTVVSTIGGIGALLYTVDSDKKIATPIGLAALGICVALWSIGRHVETWDK